MNATPAQRIVITKRGGPEALRLVDMPAPTPGRGELLVRVEATGVAFADVLMRLGLYPGTTFPVTPGYEVVGPVLAGEGFAAGTRIAALTVTGGYATHAVVPAAHAVAVPDALPSPAAAALVLNGLTALGMLSRVNALPGTRSMLVWGAAGGVGSLLLELGRHHGVRTFGVASGARRAAVEAAGAISLDRAGDVPAQLRRHLPEGVDLVIDGVGGKATAASLAMIRSGGQVVMYGVQGGVPGGRRSLGELAGGWLASPRRRAFDLFIRGAGLRSYRVTDWRHVHAEDLATLFDLAVAGAITPRIHGELPLAEAGRAHELLGRGEVAGKLILRP